jgi:hypothetical protein
MYRNTKFRKATWGLDAVLIWGGAATGLLTGIIGLVEGWGMAVSLLIALAALPLAMLSIAIIRYRKQFANAVAHFFGGDTSFDKEDPKLWETEDEEALNKLTLFVIDTLLPACHAQEQLQVELLRKICPNDKILNLASRGLLSGEFSDMNASIERLMGLHDSPAAEISLTEMMKHVDLIERRYASFCKQASEIAKSISRETIAEAKIDVTDEWRAWESHHERLVEEFESFRRDRRFKKLYRPGRENRFRESEASIESITGQSTSS